jgi:glyceraldehyde 3-phosphate dehydrogenase
MGTIAMYGFGRIGRSMLKATLTASHGVPISIADIRDLSAFAALLAADFQLRSLARAGRRTWQHLHDRRPRDRVPRRTSKELPDWAALDVELVVDATGRAVTRSGAQAHLDRGAKRVLVSAPSKSLHDCGAVVLPGIHLDQFDRPTCALHRQHGEAHHQRAGTSRQGHPRALRYPERPLLDRPRLYQIRSR